jgi:hypothetical protein
VNANTFFLTWIFHRIRTKYLRDPEACQLGALFVAYVPVLGGLARVMFFRGCWHPDPVRATSFASMDSPGALKHEALTFRRRYPQAVRLLNFSSTAGNFLLFPQWFCVIVESGGDDDAR